MENGPLRRSSESPTVHSPSSRHKSERHARPERAPGPFARPAERQPRQDRDCPDDAAFGSDRLGHHARARGRRPAAAPGAAARQGRPAVHPDGAQSRRRLFHRPQDRPPQRRTGSDRFSRQCPRHAAEFVPLSGAARDPRFRRLRHQAPARRPHCRTGQADRRAGDRHAVRTVELGRHGGRPARDHGPVAAPRHPRRHPGVVRLPRLSPERCHRRLRRGTGLRPDGQFARFHLFLHRRLRRRRHRAQRQAVQRTDRQRRARSVRCRFPAPTVAPPS